MRYALLTLSFFSTYASFAQIAISPTSVDVSPSLRIAEIHLDNKGNDERMFEAVIKHWSQDNNEDKFKDTNDVIILPKAATIKPKSKQKLRIVLQNPAPDKTQKYYRIFLSEVLGQKKVTKSGLSFLLSINVPLYSNGKDFQQNIKSVWSIVDDKPKGKSFLSLENTGNTHLIVKNLKMLTKPENIMSTMQYVLPGTKFQWELPNGGTLKKDKIDFQFDLFEKANKISVLVPKIQQPKVSKNKLPKNS